jgi:hypothetical protein
MWGPGRSGNPGGRPKVSREWKDICRRMEPEAMSALRKALQTKGERVPAAALILAYSRGRPEVRATVRVIHSLADLTEQELLAIIGRGTPDAIEGDATELLADVATEGELPTITTD